MLEQLGLGIDWPQVLPALMWAGGLLAVIFGVGAWRDAEDRKRGIVHRPIGEVIAEYERLHPTLDQRLARLLQPPPAEVVVEGELLSSKDGEDEAETQVVPPDSNAAEQAVPAPQEPVPSVAQVVPEANEARHNPRPPVAAPPERWELNVRVLAVLRDPKTPEKYLFSQNEICEKAGRRRADVLAVIRDARGEVSVAQGKAPTFTREDLALDVA